ncbi:MAG: AMP-binding protein [Thermoguttaceae bacterium]|nr:AMP-binding protein [Thermoguttaceae bacterium]
MIPVRQFLRICHQQAGILKIADSSGKELTGRQVLMGALVFRHFFHRAIFSKDEKYVGILLPPNVYTTIVNAALALDKRVAVNLNYTVSNEIMNQSIETAGVKHIITSRKFLDKLPYHDLNAELVILEEDVAPKISLGDKIKGAIEAYSPCWFVDWLLGLNDISPDDVLTVIFTSGSTGVPKGVMLTHDNIGSNIDSFMNLERIDWPDILMGVMPTFHAFGYTINIWVILTKRVRAVYHHSPLEPKIIGKLTKKYQCTAMIATPTFFRLFIRKCEPDDLKSIEIPVAGGEHMPIEVMDAFEAKFGARPLEGFGATECSPVVCANILERRRVHKDEILRKDGSIGLPVPGVLVEIRDIDTGEVLGANQVGMMWVRGRNVMKGYLNMPEKTAEVIKDGWYCTGDLAKIDEDGFIYITGRLSRFSKIGGEMVPHEGIEKIIGDIIGLTPDEPLTVIVTAVPSVRKGERIIVLYTDLKGKKPEEIVSGMRENNISPIWIPTVDSFIQVENIPLLGTGKLDIKGAKNLALSLVDVE